MKLEVPLDEVRDFINNQYKVNVNLKNIEKDKIEANYLESVILIVKDVREEVVYLDYEVDGLAVIAAKLANFFLKKKLENSPLEWDSKEKTITVDLNKVPDMEKLLKTIHISEIHVENENISIEFFIRDITEK